MKVVPFHSVSLFAHRVLTLLPPLHTRLRYLNDNYLKASLDILSPLTSLVHMCGDVMHDGLPARSAVPRWRRAVGVSACHSAVGEYTPPPSWHAPLLPHTPPPPSLLQLAVQQLFHWLDPRFALKPFQPDRASALRAPECNHDRRPLGQPARIAREPSEPRRVVRAPHQPSTPLLRPWLLLAYQQMSWPLLAWQVAPVVSSLVV